jgi:hypothetical protein
VAYLFAVHKAHTQQYLLHELDGFALCQVLLLSDEVKQLSSTNTDNKWREVLELNSTT